MTLQALLHHPTALPAAPRLVQELISSLDHEDAAVDDIARKLSLDPVISAKLLRLANSSYYHVSRRIGNVSDAVRMLGFVTVRTLVISSGLVGSFRAIPGFDLKRFWRYSLHTAVAARWIAQQTGANPDLAFTIGMMHALGQLVMHTGAPEQVQEANRLAGSYQAGRLAAETAACGYNFSEVGAALAELWNFPDLFVRSLREFPDPAAAIPLNRMAAVIHLAAWRARAAEAQASAEDMAATAPLVVAALLGLTEAALLAMPGLAELGAGLEELVS